MNDEYSELKKLFVSLDSVKIAYTFSEFKKLTWDKEIYYEYLFYLTDERNKVYRYITGFGRSISFNDFFEKCSEEMQEHILFNLDFFTSVY